MAKFLIKTIQVNFVLIPSEAGMGQHKLTELLLNFCHQPIYHHSHFLAAPFDLTTSFTLAILNRAAPFLQPGCFE